MIASPEHGFLNFQKRLLFRFLIVALMSSFILKFVHILLVYNIVGPIGPIEDVAGMSLVKFARSVAWSDALSFGGVASLSVIVAIAGLLLTNRFKVRVKRIWIRKDQGPQRELVVYFFLLVLSLAISRLGVVAADTMAFLLFLPLTVYSLLSPVWRGGHAKVRVVAAIFIALAGFALAGSKTIVLHLTLALVLSSIYSSRRWWATIVFSLIFVIIYPYLNIFRGAAGTMGVSAALTVTLTQLERDFYASGFLQLLLNAYGAILDRIVGLDGLLVATIFQGQEGLTSREISFQLAGFEGVGISLGMFGKLYTQFQDLFMAALIYPLVVLMVWRVTVIVADEMSVHGFASFSTFLFIKSVNILIGGFRWTDIKLTISAMLAVLSCGFIWYIASSIFGPRQRIFHKGAATKDSSIERMANENA